jgi:hypothetical protein
LKATAHKGAWTADEDKKLKEAVKLHDINHWVAIFALVPGRSGSQCFKRWENAFKPSIAIARATGRKGAWTGDEDRMLQEAVQLYGAKNWIVIATLVLSGSNVQCNNRWLKALTTRRLDVWTESEDDKLKHAVQMRHHKGWAAVAALVPGRTSIQCTNRWYDVLKHSIDQAAGRTVS